MARTVEMLGCVADLCPICHVVERFRIYRHGNAWSVQRIPLGRGALFRCEAICDTCGWSHVVDASAFRSVIYEPLGTIRQLLAATNPDLPARAARELDRARALQSGTLTPDQRLEAVADVFRAIATFASTDASSQAGSLGGEVKMRFFMTLLLLGLLVAACNLLDLPFQTGWRIFLGLVAAMIAWTIWSSRTESARFARRVLRPLLARGLAPLSPTTEEIAAAARAHRRFLKTYGAALDGLEKALAAG